MIHYFDYISSWLHRKDINAFHCALFHGAVSRNGLDASSRPWPSPQHQSINPLSLVCGCDYPSIISSSGRLIVAEKVAELIVSEIPLRFVEVDIKKVINIPLAAVNQQMDRLLRRYGRNPDGILEGEPNDEIRRQQLGKYLELIAYVEPDLPRKSVPREFDCGFDRFCKARTSVVSSDILDEFHVILFGGCFVSDRLFRLLQPHLNLDYFFVKSFSD